MKTFFQIVECIHNSFAVASLLHAAETLLRCLLLSLVCCCGIAAAQDRSQDRPTRSWFMLADDATPRLAEPSLRLTQQPDTSKPTVKLGQPRSKVGGNGAGSWFMKPTERAELPPPAAAPVLPPMPSQPFDGEVGTGTGTGDFGTFEPTPQPDPASLDTIIPPRVQRPDYPTKVIYRPTLASLMSEAITFRDEIPPELGERGPETQVKLIGYTIPNCPPCEVAKVTFAEPYRGMSVAWELTEPWAGQNFPCVVDRERNLSFATHWLRDWPTLWARVNERRAEKGLPVCSAVDDSPLVVGEVRRELVEPITNAGEGSCVCSNRMQEFSQKAYTVSIPANLSIKWATAPDGAVKVAFPNEPPKIRVNGWFTFNQNVKSVTVERERVLVGLSWWRKLSFEVR